MKDTARTGFAALARVTGLALVTIGAPTGLQAALPLAAAQVAGATAQIGTPAPVPKSIENIAATLRAMGREDVASRLITDVRRRRVVIAPIDGNAETDPPVIIPLVTDRTNNVMTLDRSLETQCDTYRTDRDPVTQGTLSWALTVVHEYVHMNQDNPVREARFEDIAWRTALAENQRWMQRVMSRITDVELHAPNGPDKIAELTRLTETLNDLRNVHNGSANDLQAEINAGHVGNGLDWSTLDMGTTRDLGEVQAICNRLVDTFNANTRASIARFERELRRPAAVVPPARPAPTPAAPTSLTLELPGYWGHLSYSVSGADLAAPTGSDRGNVGGRQYTGQLLGPTLKVEGTAISDNASSGPGSGDYYELVVSVTAGRNTRDFSYIAPQGERMHQPFSLSVPVDADATSGSFTVNLLEQNASHGEYGWKVGGRLTRDPVTRSAAPAQPATPAPARPAAAAPARPAVAGLPADRGISGSWRRTDGRLTYTFSPDGRAAGVIGDVHFSGQWTKTTDGKYRVAWSLRPSPGAEEYVDTVQLAVNGASFSAVNNYAQRFSAEAYAPAQTSSPAASPLLPRPPAAGCGQEETLYANGNADSVANGPSQPTRFTLAGPAQLTLLLSYHWNFGRGEAPGMLSLEHEDGTRYGPWQAVGEPGQGGVANANWVVRPMTMLKVGTYTVSDSSQATWARNPRSLGQGIVTLKGCWVR